MTAKNSAYRIRVAAAEGAFSLEYNPFQEFSAWNQERHANASFELHLVLSGAASVSVGEQALRLLGGDVLIISSGAHHMSASEPGIFEHLSISFTMAKGNGIFSGPPDFRLFAAPAAALAAAGALIRETKAPRPFREEMLSILLKELFLHILRSEGLSAGETPPAENAFGEPFDLGRARTDLIDVFFEQHHAEHVSESQLAEALHVSVRQLSRILKKNYGMNFSEKLLSARMDHAAWLLRTTDLSVAAVSEAAGFSSEGNLFRRFRTRFGMTPGQYRLGR